MGTQKYHPSKFSESDPIPLEVIEAARIAIRDSLRVRAHEQVFIVTNPDPEVSILSRALYDAAVEVGAQPLLMFQGAKTQLDFAERGIIAAFSSEPEVFISMSAEKLGKDRRGIAEPYSHGGTSWDHIFHLQLYGTKTCRAFWSPGTTVESFIRTVPIDYDLLKRRCGAIADVLTRAVSVRVQAPGGTDVKVGLRGRTAKSDDGDFSVGGQGGNLPAGETFISPENNTTEGTIVFDGSMSLHNGDILIREPIRCVVRGGYISEIGGASEAEALRETVEMAERNAREYERTGKLQRGSGEIYAKNARNIGELGIGLNPRATISGNMLEDEKAFSTCHFAVGHNYDEDAPALIHLDGLVKNPTITAFLPDGTSVVIEREGRLEPSFLHP